MNACCGGGGVNRNHPVHPSVCLSLGLNICLVSATPPNR